jgi:plasmid stability protein
MTMKKRVIGKQAQPPYALISAEKALKIFAAREGISVEEVRKHIQLAMLSGLASTDPTVQANWAGIPCTGNVPTPEELIAACATKYAKKR